MRVSLVSPLLLRTLFTSRLLPGLPTLDTYQLAGSLSFSGSPFYGPTFWHCSRSVAFNKRFGSKGWWFLRVIGLNYIAYAFASDFLKYPEFGSVKFLIGYAPFAIFSVLGPLLCFAAFIRRITQDFWRSS